MKETGTIHWVSPNNGVTNTSGLTGIAAGFYDYTIATPVQSLKTHN